MSAVTYRNTLYVAALVDTPTRRAGALGPDLPRCLPRQTERVFRCGLAGGDVSCFSSARWGSVFSCARTSSHTQHTYFYTIATRRLIP